MTPAHEIYIRQCAKEFKDSISWCKRCDPNPEPVIKRWEDALLSVADYVDGIAVPKGFPKVKVSPHGDPMVWGNTWEAGVFAGDSYDSGVQKWYWRIAKGAKEQWADTPVDALISCIAELEKAIGADPAARTLVFTVRMPSVTCTGDDHDWKFLYEGRHGSDKGDMVYECKVCKKTKHE